jgi:hypothetical protein
VRTTAWPLVEGGHIRPRVHAVFPLSAAADAHRAMEAGTAMGKVLLTTNPLEDSASVPATSSDRIGEVR